MKKTSSMILTIVIMSLLLLITGCGKKENSYYTGVFFRDDKWGGQQFVIMKDHTCDYQVSSGGRWITYHGTWEETEDGQIKVTFEKHGNAQHWLTYIDENSFKTSHHTDAPTLSVTGFGGTFTRK